VAALEKASRLAEHAIQLAPSEAILRVQQAGVEIVLGDALLKLGDRPQTLLHYQRGLELLAPSVQRGDNLTAAFNTAVLYSKLGDEAVIDGRTADSVPHYEQALRMVSRLAAAEPHNEPLRRQEAVCLTSLGHALTEMGRADEGVRYSRQALARLGADATSTAMTRSIEFLIRGWLGEALERQGKIREASHEYAVSQQILGAVRAGGADDRRVQGYFASATDRLAATLVKLGEIDQATHEYEKTRTLLEPVVKANPEDQELAYVLAETYTAEGLISAERAAQVRDRAEKLGDWRAASVWFRKSLDTWSAVPHPTRISTSGFEVTMPAEVSNRLARCEREIRSLGGRPQDRP
jgi:tetratricopeptide (TPR) repeat protein